MSHAFHVDHLFGNASEKPLDRVVPNGGYARILRTIGIVGDSLSAGEYETKNAQGESEYTDIYENSWASYLANVSGIKIKNFSRGGMTAREYLDSWAEKNDFWQAGSDCLAFIVALGVNDLFFRGVPIDHADDSQADYSSSFKEQFCEILQRYRVISPQAKFFLMTMPKGQLLSEWNLLADQHRQLMYEIAAQTSDCYVIDLRAYAPELTTDAREKLYLNGHLSPIGYVWLSDMVGSYLDYLIRQHYADFVQIGFPY